MAIDGRDTQRARSRSKGARAAGRLEITWSTSQLNRNGQAAGGNFPRDAGSPSAPIPGAGERQFAGRRATSGWKNELRSNRDGKKHFWTSQRTSLRQAMLPLSSLRMEPGCFSISSGDLRAPRKEL